jgi:uncharacterized DUF497 family protein
MAQFIFVEWLALWLVQAISIEFDWDDGNLIKSLIKHRVSDLEVEEVFMTGLAVPIGVQVSPIVDEERLAVVGPTSDGRLITIAFTLRDGKIRPISSRTANRKEKKLYETVRKIT